MATQVAPLGLRLFLEGIEVPVIAAQVMIQPSQPAVAAIQIIPTDSALFFLPRTLVHLFYLDSEAVTDERALTDRISAENELFPDSRRKKIDRFDVEDERYKLLFSGEVVGFNYQKTPSSRSLVLQCLDLSSYWDTCYQWFADFSVGGDGLTDRTHHFVGAGEGLFNNIASGTRWVIGNILTTKPANPEYQNTQGLLAGYIHLLESIGGLRPKAKSYEGFRGVNDFFTIAELKYNLSGMIGAVADDTTSARLYSHKAFFNWLEQGMCSAGSLVSYRDVLRLVGQYIFHDVYPNPAGRFVKGGAKVQQTLSLVYKESTVGKTASKFLQDAIDRLTTARSTLNGAIGANNTASLPFDDGRTALTDADKAVQDAVTAIREGRSTDSAAVAINLELARSQIQAVFNAFNAVAQTNGANREDLINVERARTFGAQLDDPIALLDKVLNASTSKRKTESRTVTTSDHLYNQLLLPETFFVVPPRCNIIFPDQYSHFNFSRNFMREVTRLSVQGGLGIISGGRRGDAILSRYYFAPNIRDVRGKMARRTVFSQGSTILPHEIHSGIIPKFEWVTDGHRWGIKAAQTQGKTTEEQKKIHYIQRLANFQFFLNRFAARQLSCTARFSPMLVVGFPAVIIDRTLPSPAALEVLTDTLGGGNSILPTAYIGKIVSLTHDINQAGGTTSVALSHARTHRGIDDEFLGVVARERKDIVDREVEIDPSLFGPGAEALNEGEEAKLLVKHLSKTLTIGGTFQSEKILSVTEDPETISMSFATLSLIGLPLDVFQKILTEQSLAELDEDVSTINVTKRLTIGLRQKTNLGKFVTPESAFPPEDLLQPGWYSPVWSRENITKSVYLPLLGCSAITDDQAVGDADGFAGVITQALKDSGIQEATAEAVVQGQSVAIKVGDRTITVFDVATGSLEQAIDGLTALYGLLKKRDLDVQQFINDYTRRPIANLVEILGSSNLEFDDNGDVKDPETMVEGFHSRAFGDYNTDVKHRNPPADDDAEVAEPIPGAKALFGLIPADKEGAFTRGIADRGRKLPKVPPYLDPRGRAYQRVLAYARELEVSRGLLGGT